MILSSTLLALGIPSYADCNWDIGIIFPLPKVISPTVRNYNLAAISLAILTGASGARAGLRRALLTPFNQQFL